MLSGTLVARTALGEQQILSSSQGATSNTSKPFTTRGRERIWARQTHPSMWRQLPTFRAETVETEWRALHLLVVVTEADAPYASNCPEPTVTHQSSVQSVS
jgi:hypothetical protein